MVVAAAVMLAVMALAVCVWAPDKIIRKCLALPFRQVATEALVAKCGKSAETCETPTISPTCSSKDSDRPTRHTFRMEGSAKMSECHQDPTSDNADKQARLLLRRQNRKADDVWP